MSSVPRDMSRVILPLGSDETLRLEKPLKSIPREINEFLIKELRYLLLPTSENGLGFDLHDPNAIRNDNLRETYALYQFINDFTTPEEFYGSLGMRPPQRGGKHRKNKTKKSSRRHHHH